MEKSLIDYLKEIPDFREASGCRHPLWLVLLIIIMGITSGEYGCRVQSIGFIHHRYGNDLGFWLPEQKSLQEVVNLFIGIEIDLVSVQPVRLENIYVELTREAIEIIKLD